MANTMNKQRRVAVMLDLEWPYKRHTGIFAGMQEYALAHNWDTIIDEFVHHTLQSLPSKSVPYDGIFARVNQPLAVQAKRLRIPLVNVWASSPARAQVPGVYPDATEAGRLCAEHLMARGFRNFASLITQKNQIEVQIDNELKRIVVTAGHSFTTEKASHTPSQNLAFWRKTEALVARGMDRWKLPIGVYVGTEMIGRLVVQMCRRRGWRVPEDVAIIAGQNQETMCEYPRPSLSSIEIGYERIGSEAARLLDGLMNGAEPPNEPILMPPHSLVLRESTDFFAIKDELVASALAFISANSHRRIGPNDVARAVGAETRTLQNYFRKVLQRSIAAEIRRVRIERAKRELAQTVRPLAEIAHDVGFGNMQRLYEVFLREVGVTPSAYRSERNPKKRL
ncbi:DNA-binding transcriptional regulator [soil metagenome]